MAGLTPRIVLLAALAGPIDTQRVTELPRLKAVGESVWISRDAIAAPSGDLDLSLLPPSDAGTLRNYLRAAPQAGCISIEGVQEDAPNDVPPETLDEALSAAGFIAEGTVTGLSPGFYRGVPGQLVQLELKKKYRDVAHGDWPRTLYVFFPIGDFAAGKYRFCKRDQRYPAAPVVGDDLFFAGVPPLGRSGDVLGVRHAFQLAVGEAATGAVRYSPDAASFESKLPGSESELRRRITEAVRALRQ